ncbi:glucoamylase [Saccharopolyspora erythraea NRRL 2338]|uniref:Trehalase n=2 Tax=Saccharopolyspora erythraea TaxID=1836 RepID=A4FQG9_SACEN|nr:glycoside hydrolase family 15 protein [Saccharopolyspora erythraea]EQD86616.1 glucoamylase [Saccharopolyspora erythraea D]PFG92895.1 glucoamylase [Saccharopolyspora erythraea NRRL 2338]QRK89798.1 glycoside hydrolase family 15 protein [Saccharopolyspora erythraea]CAM06294.1 glucoamylase [Saccharopolyspora erythraea NRRL 2338]
MTDAPGGRGAQDTDRAGARADPAEPDVGPDEHGPDLAELGADLAEPGADLGVAGALHGDEVADPGGPSAAPGGADGVASTTGGSPSADAHPDDLDTDRGGPGLIEDYALLSDLRTAALVGRDGSVDWLCLPRFDWPSCFARLLGADHDGHWQIAPVAPVRRVERRYRENSLVLETDFHTDNGVVRVVDSMPPHEKNHDDQPCLVRMVEGVSGEVAVRMRWVVRFAYGDTTPWVRRVRETDPVLDEYILAVAGPHTVVLRGDDLPRRVPHQRAHEAVCTVRAGERKSWVMQWSPDPDELPAPMDPEQETRDSEDFWRTWTRKITYCGPHRDAVYRSLATLKALTYAPTGGIVAAPTASLPETLGGDRNWDYRFCWLRDATFVLLALDNFGCQMEAGDWRRWLVRATAGDPRELQIMYGVGGERHLLEWEADWLPGYQGAAPVRIGNAAHRQRQLDVYGEVMDALHLARERGLTETPESWAVQRGMMRHLEQIWRAPDRGLWEVRGPERYFTHSQVMVWVAFDRAVRAIEEDGLPGPLDRWRGIRDTVRAEVLEHGWNDDVGAFTQYYGGRTLDAATLLLPAVGFLPADDERMRSTVRAIQRELQPGGLLVERYSTSDDTSVVGVDGLTGREGAFLACSFWLVDALALGGRRDEAEEMFSKLVALANDVGLYAEEYDVRSGRFVGNFPQAFTHVALVNSAAVLYGGHARHEASRRDGRGDR